jgi:hypothetical protein
MSASRTVRVHIVVVPWKAWAGGGTHYDVVGSGTAPCGWRRPVSLPADLAELRGPLTGMVQLPLGVYASGQGPARRFDMTNEVERIELYEIVLTDGTAEDVCRYVNREELLRLWPRLWLPPHVRRVWEPRLGVVAS